MQSSFFIYVIFLNISESWNLFWDNLCLILILWGSLYLILIRCKILTDVCIDLMLKCLNSIHISEAKYLNRHGKQIKISSFTLSNIHIEILCMYICIYIYSVKNHREQNIHEVEVLENRF